MKLQIAAVLLVVLSAVNLGMDIKPSKGQGVTSCAQLVHQQVKAAVEANGLRYVKESLWACHQDGNESVARVRVWFDQIQWTGVAFTPVRQSVVLVLKFTKSPWQMTSFQVASETP